MNISNIITSARRLANVNSVQWSDSDIMLDLNIVYHNLCETIINSVGEDFFLKKFTADTVIGQTRYTLQKATDTVVGHKKIKRVSVKYSSNDEYYQVLKEYDSDNLYMDKDYYASNTAKEDGFFYVEGDSIYIYPAPTEVILEGIRIESSITPIDLVLGGAEETILIPRQFHNIMVWGLLVYIFQHLGKTNEKNDAINNYERLKNEMVRDLSDRVSSPLLGSLPNLSYLE